MASSSSASLLRRAAFGFPASTSNASLPTASLASTRLSSVTSHLSNRRNMSASQQSQAASQSQNMPTFDKSPVPKNPLGEGKFVTTAGCLIIGDEVLNGKTKDSNSNYLAKFLFNLGVELKKIEVIPDDEDTIVEAVQRMSSSYDFVVSSGGIGPTPDDITYQSMAKAFGGDENKLVYHDETLRRMAELNKRRNLPEQTEEMITARKRMALFPSLHSEVLFTTEQLWVPVVRMGGKVCILPGVPRLFEALLDGLEQYIPIDPNRPRPYRLLIHTKLPESNISPFLVKLTDKCKALNPPVRVGSYPKWNNGVDVSIIGNDLAQLQELGKEIEKEIDGQVVSQGKIGEK